MSDDLLHEIIKGGSGIVLLCFLWYFVRLFNDTRNPLEWWHLVATERGGNVYADWNKIGQGLGVALCVWLPAVYVYSPKMDATGLALVMGVALTYLGGVSAYASSLRAKQKAESLTKPQE